MRYGAVLSPIGDWQPIAEAALTADELAIDSIGLWDHYHSVAPDLPYVAGWSAYGALATLTKRVTLLPMVLNSLHFELGVIAKESSVLAAVSDGRFELGIGAGDWKASFEAWGRPFPDADVRIAMLGEAVAALQAVWTGKPVSFHGEHVELAGAICTPAPQHPPRIVVGAGGSARTIRAAVAYADEINVYADASVLEFAQEAIAATGRKLDVSVYLGWEWDRWPADPRAELAAWEERGANGVYVSLAAVDMRDRLMRLADARW